MRRERKHGERNRGSSSHAPDHNFTVKDVLGLRRFVAPCPLKPAALGWLASWVRYAVTYKTPPYRGAFLSII
jgi:hypothetical protein